MAGVQPARSRHSLYQNEDQDGDGDVYPVFTTTTSFQPTNGKGHYDYPNGGLRRSDSPAHYRNSYAEPAHSRSNGVVYQAYPKTGTENNERRLDSYFSFLNDPKANAQWERDHPGLRGRKTGGRDESVVNRVFAIIFCVVELIIGLGLISYGAVRTSRIHTSLIQGPLLPLNTTEASQTASSCMEIGIFLVFFGLVGIIGFSMALRAMKVAHLILGDITAILTIYGILYGAAEIDSRRMKHIDSNQFAADVTVLVLLASIIFLLILTTCTQATFGLFVPYYRRHRTWATSLTVFAIFLTIFTTILTVVAALCLRDTLDHRPVLSINTATLIGEEWVYQYKRNISISAIVTGFWAWILSFLAIGSVFSKSRPVALTVTVLWIPSLYVLIKVTLHSSALLVPALSSSWYAKIGPSSTVGIFYTMFGVSFVTEIFLFATVCFAVVSVFRK